MFHDNLLHTHLNVAMYNWKTINIIQSIRIIWYYVLVNWWSWTNATRCSRNLRRTNITNITTLIMIMIVISITRTNDTTGWIVLNPWRYDVRWWIFLRFAVQKFAATNIFIIFIQIQIFDSIFNFEFQNSWESRFAS